MSECTEKLKINPALRLLVLPLSTAEYTALETDILTNGSQKPVQCWHSYIISDFERVEICRRHKISFDVYKTNFLSEIEIVAQICERELSERILPSDMRRYLIGTTMASHISGHNDRVSRLCQFSSDFYAVLDLSHSGCCDKYTVYLSLFLLPWYLRIQYGHRLLLPFSPLLLQSLPVFPSEILLQLQMHKSDKVVLLPYMQGH